MKRREVTKKGRKFRKSLFAEVAKSSHKEGKARRRCQHLVPEKQFKWHLSLLWRNGSQQGVTVLLCHLFWMGSCRMQFSRVQWPVCDFYAWSTLCVTSIVNNLSIRWDLGWKHKDFYLLHCSLSVLVMYVYANSCTIILHVIRSVTEIIFLLSLYCNFK